MSVVATSAASLAIELDISSDGSVSVKRVALVKLSEQPIADMVNEALGQTLENIQTQIALQLQEIRSKEELSEIFKRQRVA